mmetsp:Transcript_22226/g.65860  ORF Transcript_22226/g.65860 Transcript_22226/m.65860 type:complete len:206 (-) Transcript_22226:67-684(-)
MTSMCSKPASAKRAESDSFDPVILRGLPFGARSGTTWEAASRKIWKAGVSDLSPHAAIATRPDGLRHRSTSWSPRAGSGKKMTEKIATAQSNLPLHSDGRFCPSHAKHSIPSLPLPSARRRARSTMDSETSVAAMGEKPRDDAKSAPPPVPHPTSRSSSGVPLPAIFDFRAVSTSLAKSCVNGSTRRSYSGVTSLQDNVLHSVDA